MVCTRYDGKGKEGHRRKNMPEETVREREKGNFIFRGRLDDDLVSSLRLKRKVLKAPKGKDEAEGRP